MDKKNILYKMLLVRRMEQTIESLFSKGVLRGTTHCCIGQEGVPAVLSELIDIEKDYLCSGHRAHGLSILLSESPERLLGEIMGKPYGLAKGLGGSQHVYYKNYFTNGITGGMAPVATGIAFTLKHEATDAISVVVYGDGAMNEGYVLEAFNLAVEMDLPILFLLENNGYAMSTPVETVNPFVTFENRVKGFGLPYTKVSASCFDNLYDVIEQAVNKVRKTRSPQFVEVLTHRFCGHSKSDKRLYIPQAKDDYWHEHDTIIDVANSLSPDVVEAIKKDVEIRVTKCVEYCNNN